MSTIGFVGAGNMAAAIVRGALGKKLWRASQVYLYDEDTEKLEALANELGVQTATDNAELCQSSDFVMLCVKPQHCARALSQIREHVADKALCSIVTGYTMQKLQAELPESARVLRVMPNTPALVGQGMSVLCSGHTLREPELKVLRGLFEALGRVLFVEESQFDAVTGVAGSGPAYAYLFIEALSDAGVKLGLPRQNALLLAAQTVRGAAEMVLATGQHPAQLKDAVCSPAGTTIEAVRVLERGGLRSTVIEAAIASAERAAQLSKS